MIRKLRVQNVALIDEIEIDFAPGLNILTGETGAGKSILVDSINFLLGGRPSRDFVRAGASYAHVEGILEINDPIVIKSLEDLGVEVPEGEILLGRVQSDGKSTCRVNGRTVTVGLLKDVASLLVDIHGQHEHQSLLDTTKQLHLLDQFCGAELLKHKSTLDGLLKRYRETEKALKAIAGVGNQRQEQLDMWRFQLEEIEQAQLSPDEEGTLTARKNRLRGLEKLTKSASETLSLLSEGDGDGQLSVADQLARALVYVSDITKLDPEREELHSDMADAVTLITDIIADLRAYTDELDADPYELEQIEERLDLIYKLKKRYGISTISDILEKEQELIRNLDALENSDAEIKRLQTARRAISSEITTVCDAMNALRVEAAGGIGESISSILRDLGMQNGRFYIVVNRKKAFGPDGNDDVEFMIATNPGEPEKPLRRIASGGEMSRVMLAIKTVMADADRMDTVIFDEVDTGVSGRTAQQVAEKLMGISRHRQILCITHLPQIAAMADTHFLIEKSILSTIDSKRTVTRVYPLETGRIIEELARLIGGAIVTETTRTAAKEMRLQAKVLKNMS